MSERRAHGRMAVVLAVFGVMSLLSMLGRPSLAGIRAVDVVHLIGAGMCLGGALVAFGSFVRSRNAK